MNQSFTKIKRLIPLITVTKKYSKQTYINRPEKKFSYLYWTGCGLTYFGLCIHGLTLDTYIWSHEGMGNTPHNIIKIAILGIPLSLSWPLAFGCLIASVPLSLIGGVIGHTRYKNN